MKTPSFWYPKRPGFSFRRLALSPIAALYAAGAARKTRSANAFEPSVPVVCLGNATVGGVGKTPTTAAIARLLQGAGVNPVILMRGYGGRIKKATRVDLKKHSASVVGDEPVLLSPVAPVWIGKNRAKAAAMAAAHGPDVILMDDGFQNPSVAKTLSFLLIDAERGFGNGATLPAGPLREPPDAALARADALIFVKSGPSASIRKDLFTLGFGKMPRFQAWLTPQNPEPKRVVAFSGIGHPDKFFTMLKTLDYDVVTAESFPDHHKFTQAELKELRVFAEKKNAALITTDKDYARLDEGFRKHVETLSVEMEFDQPERLLSMITHAIDQNKAHAGRR